jgi:hypothetical protein
MDGLNVWDGDTSSGVAPPPPPPEKTEGLDVYSDAKKPPPSFLDRAWQTLVGAPTEAVHKVEDAVSPSVPPVLQGVAPPAQDREAANAGFSEGFRRLAGKGQEILASQPPVGPYTADAPVMPSDTDTSVAVGPIRAANQQSAQAYNEKYGDNPDAQRGILLANLLIGTPAAIGAPLAAAGLAEGAGLPGLAAFLGGTAGEGTGGVTGLLTRAASRATAGGIGGAGAGVSTTDPSQPAGPQIMDAAVNAGLLAPAAGAALDIPTELTKRLGGRYIGGRLPDGSLDPAVVERARQAQVLRANGVDFSGSQISQDPLAAAVSDKGGVLPGSGAKPYSVSQDRQFGGAAMRTMGEPNEPLATQPVMDANMTRISNDFQTVAQHTDIPQGNLLPGMGRIGVDLNTAPPSAAQSMTPVMRDILATVQRNNGVLPGAEYLRLTRPDSPLSRLARSADAGAPYAQDLLDELHGGLQVSAPQQYQGLVEQARGQYRAWHAINDASNSDGTITPDNLYTVTQGQSGRFGNSRGRLDDLADAGKTILGSRTSAPVTSAGLALTMKVLGAIGGGSALATAPVTLPLNRGLQVWNRASGGNAANTALQGGGTPIVPWLSRTLQGAATTAGAQTRPQNFGGGGG